MSDYTQLPLTSCIANPKRTGSLSPMVTSTSTSPFWSDCQSWGWLELLCSDSGSTWIIVSRGWCLGCALQPHGDFNAALLRVWFNPLCCLISTWSYWVGSEFWSMLSGICWRPTALLLNFTASKTTTSQWYSGSETKWKTSTQIIQETNPLGFEAINELI